MKYNVGDKVRIREDLVMGGNYGCSIAVLEVIGKSEKRVKELRRELDKETREKSLTTPERIEKIKKISDVWDKLDVKEQNKVLKECIDKIVITEGNIDIYFNLL